MTHPQMTAIIAAQHRCEMQQHSEQVRRVKQAGAHGVRVVARTPAAHRSVWNRVAAALGATATPTCRGGLATP